MEVATRYNPVSQFESTFPRTIGEPADMRKWEAVFGPMPDKPVPSPFSAYPVEHFQLPRAYEGTNVFLAEKISGLVNTTGDFWTGRLLPWQQTDHIGPFTWTEWKFNQVLASRVPHEGVPRLVTTSEEKYMARPVRRGLAAEFEGDFVNHPKGQIQMARKIQGMVVSIQTTINLDVQHTILMSQNEKRTRSLKTRVTRVPIKDEIQMEVDNWNAVSKNPDAFNIMTAKVKRYLLQAGAQAPLVLLVTPETPLYMHTVDMPNRSGEAYNVDINQRQMDDQLLNPSADGNFTLKDGTQVIEIKDMTIEENAPPEQLFTRQCIIGEFNTINWIDFAHANLYDGCGDGSGRYHYCSDHRSILIHDMELDRMAKITLEECIENGGPEGFPDMGILRNIIGDRQSKGGFTAKDFYPDERDLRSGARSLRSRNAHMMLFWNRDIARIVRHIGNMDQNVTSHHTIRQIGQSLCAMANLTDEDAQTAIDLIRLLQELEEAPYNFQFFKALITVNGPYSLRLNDDSRTIFVGETITDAELANKWGYSMGIPEWKPQYHGGLKIPDPQSPFDDIIPPGLASLAGLQGLAALPESSYGGIAGRAKEGLALVKKLYNAWSGVLHAEFLDASNRAPWYHAKDGMYTFFDNVIYMARDPLFLAAPNPVDATRPKDPAAPKGKKVVDNDFFVNFNEPNDFVKLLNSMKVLFSKPETLNDSGPRNYKIQTYIGVFPKFKSQSALYYIKVIAALQDSGKFDENDDINKFAEMLSSTKDESARYIIAALANDMDKLEDNVRIILSEDKKRRKTLTTKLLKQGKDILDREGDEVIEEFQGGLKKLLEFVNDQGQIEAGEGIDTEEYNDNGKADGSSFEFNRESIKRGSFYRAPLVMTPGIAKTLGMGNPRDLSVPLVLPSEPNTGHTMPVQATVDEDETPQQIQDSFKDRPSYASFIGATMKNRELQHGTIGTHHFEFLAAKHLGKTKGASSYGGKGASSRARSTPGLFASRTTFEDEDLFDDFSIVESIEQAARTKSSYSDRGTGEGLSRRRRTGGLPSGYMRVGAREDFEYKEPKPTGGRDRATFEDYTRDSEKFDRRRPLRYLLEMGALIEDYGHGETEYDETDGARLLFELDTDNMRLNVSRASGISSPMARWGALTAISARIDAKEHWLKMIRADVLVPCNVLLMRPKQEFLTDTYVLMEPGSRTGGTLFNNASSMMSWDGITRRLHLNFVFYSKAMVWNPDNISLIQDARVKQYLRGAGVTFIRNFADLTSTSRTQSFDMISIIIPIEEQRFDRYIRALGDLMNSYLDRNLVLEPLKIGQSYSSAEYVDLWLSDVEQSQSYKTILDDSQQLAGRFLESQAALPRLIFQGHQQNFSIKTGEYTNITYCKGHRGRNGAYPGCRVVYDGQEYYLDKNPNYQSDASAY